mgnify:CR=1 FL=1|tara:strand:- start:77 stop:454 length:378 start_codon:yes stop_codon:yes gene_type:complete
MPEVITNISLATFKEMLNNLTPENLIILRFTADWCGPCQRINDDCTNFFKNCSDKIYPIIIDVDESIDLYVTLKRYKMLNGIPALLAYHGNNKQDHWYISNDSVNTGDKTQVQQFLLRCNNYTNK